MTQPPKVTQLYVPQTQSTASSLLGKGSSDVSQSESGLGGEERGSRGCDRGVREACLTHLIIKYF